MEGRTDTQTELMSLFYQAQQLGHRISVDVKSEIIDRARLIDDTFRTSADVARCFLTILQGNQVSHILRQMYEMGVLDRYIPEFGRVKSLPRSGQLHQYTVDEHTLLAIENLDESTLSGTLNLEHLLQILQEVKRPELLRLAILLHDLGVGDDGPNAHNEKSHRIAKSVIQRLDILDDADAEMVLLLVENHLKMSYTARRRNLDDIKVIQRFAQLVGDEEHLKMLYLLTFADIRAVNPRLWSNWSASLLWELYSKTSRYLRGEYESDKLRLQQLQVEVEQIIGQLVDSYVMQRHFDTMPPNQLLALSPEAIAQHIRLITQLADKSHVLTCSKGTNDYSQLTICTRDELGLFRKITGVLASLNINILTAYANTRKDGIVLDMLNVADGVTGGSIDENRWQRVDALLKSVLQNKIDVEMLIDKHHEAETTIFPPENAVPLEIKIDNESSDTCTIIDIQVEDRIGLLYSVSQKLYELGLDIRFAKISTESYQATDVFYVQDEKGRKILDAKRLHKIKEGLEGTLN